MRWQCSGPNIMTRPMKAVEPAHHRKSPTLNRSQADAHEEPRHPLRRSLRPRGDARVLFLSVIVLVVRMPVIATIAVAVALVLVDLVLRSLGVVELRIAVVAPVAARRLGS